MAANVPLPSKASLVQQYVGKSLKDIPLPAAVLDIAAVKRNCKRMLHAVDELGWDLIPAVSTHKTIEITRLQIGKDPEDIRLLASSLSEVENLLPLLLEYQSDGLQVNVLYNVPISRSQIECIANISRILGRRRGTIRLLIDHEAQIPLLFQISELSNCPPYVYIAIDSGNRHMGLRHGSPELQNVFRQIEQIVLGKGPIPFAYVGFYCEPCPGHHDPTIVGSLAAFEKELRILLESSPINEIRLAVPATSVLSYLPQLMSGQDHAGGLAAQTALFKEAVKVANDRCHHVEVYTSNSAFLDLKQLPGFHATLDGPCPNSHRRREQEMPLTILTEVASLYPNRGDNGVTEALIAAGTTSFGSESHPSMGWGTLSPAVQQFEDFHGWYVQKAESKSAVLAHRGYFDGALQCGQRVRVYPYDSAKASERFGWYFVVDSSRISHGDEIVDILVRWRD